jgi:C4-dicarboxylate-specific signal transduction histidine kinase
MRELERWGRTGYLASGLAHEMGNLLTSLIARSELGLMSTDPADHRETVERNFLVARRAARLLKVFAEFARPKEPDGDAVELAEVVENAILLSGHALRKARVEALLHRAGDDRVAGPADRLLQVVLALLHAAIECLAPARGGTVDLLVERIEGEAWLEVSLRAHDATLAREEAAVAPDVPAPAGSCELSLFVARQLVTELGGRLRTRQPARGRWLYCVMLPAATASSISPSRLPR